MKMRTKCFAPGGLEPGMVTAMAIHGRHGEQLLPADSELDEGLIESIRRRGIKCIFVKVRDERDEATIRRDLELAHKRLEYIFRGDGGEARDELRAAVAAFREGQES